MKKSTKGALAAAAAGALLLGGAGSLAYWDASGTVAGGLVATGQLKLIDGTGAAACSAQTFKFADGSTYDYTYPSVSRVVPGDVLTKTCTYTVRASGQHLSADLSTVQTPDSPNSALPLQTVGSYTVGGAAATTITSADNNKSLVATITVTFPFGTSANNNSQNTNKTVGNYTVTATQTAP